MNQKIKIGILVSVFGLGLLTWKIQNENQVQKIEPEKVKMEIKAEDWEAMKQRYQDLMQKIQNQKEPMKFEIKESNYEKWLKAEAEKAKQERSKRKPPIYLNKSDLNFVRSVVAGETNGDVMDNKLMVANCIVNAIGKYGPDVRTALKKAGFAGYNSKLEYQNPKEWQRVCDAVRIIFEEGYRVSDYPIMVFYNRNKNYFKWHESQYYLGDWGLHSAFATNQDMKNFDKNNKRKRIEIEVEKILNQS